MQKKMINKHEKNKKNKGMLKKQRRMSLLRPSLSHLRTMLRKKKTRKNLKIEEKEEIMSSRKKRK